MELEELREMKADIERRERSQATIIDNQAKRLEELDTLYKVCQPVSVYVRMPACVCSGRAIPIPSLPDPSAAEMHFCTRHTTQKPSLGKA